jgi:hypothetical protein
MCTFKVPGTVKKEKWISTGYTAYGESPTLMQRSHSKLLGQWFINPERKWFGSNNQSVYLQTKKITKKLSTKKCSSIKEPSKLVQQVGLN